VVFGRGWLAMMWVPRRHEFVACWLPTRHAELSHGCPKNIHRVVHSLCALIVGRAIEISRFVRAMLAPVALLVALLVAVIPTAPAA
jgi:hypothetical protein